MSGVVRIIHEGSPDTRGRFRVRHETGALLVEALAQIPVLTSRQDDEAIRWYLEDYLLYPFDPAPRIAASIEKSMEDIGAALFRCLFDSSEQAASIWLAIRATLSDTRFEIVCGSSKETIPWELVRHPLDPVPLACAARSFVRVAGAAQEPAAAIEAPASIQVLLVIARPGGSNDIRFRSVAARILHRLGERSAIRLDVLRPATLNALEDQLSAAQARGQPYTIVHFDGHGVYRDPFARYSGPSPARMRGYLVFEDPETPDWPDYVDGDRLADVFVRNGVRVALLNACQSAKAQVAVEPGSEYDSGTVRSFGSLASELIRHGVSAVVAMRYNIWADTAAQFVANLYDRLAAGATLSHAVTLARRDLLTNARRIAVGAPRDLRDWMVPVLFESRPVSLTIPPAEEATAANDATGLPAPPTSGFIGRDNTLLELDRAFRAENAVVLWGQVGSGKTSTAAEFARWMAQTAGVRGAVLFTSFREHRALRQLVDRAASMFRERLEDTGVDWLALDDAKRARTLMQLLADPPCFWIWDNVESVEQTGWTAEEVEQLAAFLTQSSLQGAKFLLTSRNPRLPWLQDIGPVFELPPMDETERLELAVAIAGPVCSFPQDGWKPLFQFSMGNPYILSLLVHQALARRIDSTSAMNAFFDDLRSHGESDAFGSAVESVLHYQFDESELTLLSLCCLFESSVSESLLDVLADERDLEGAMFGERSGRSRCKPLLERAAAAGLVTAVGSGYYSIHPGLPGHFRRIFEAHYTPEQRTEIEDRYLFLYSALSTLFSARCQTGSPREASVAIATLSLNESNSRLALVRARRRTKWASVAALLGGFRVLYSRGERWPEFAALLDEYRDDFIDEETGEALPGQEIHWFNLQRFRVDVLMRAHRLSEAEHLQRQIVERARLSVRDEERHDDESRHALLASYSGALAVLATIQKELGSAECIATYAQALELAQRSGDVRSERAVAYEMASAYMQIEPLDLEAAEYWFAYALDIASDEDPGFRGTILSGLGAIAFRQANSNTCPADQRRGRFEESIGYYEQALDILPADQIEARATCYSNLGLPLFNGLGDATRAMQSLQQAISAFESINRLKAAGKVQLDLARMLDAAGDPARSRMFAAAALLRFASLAPDAEAELADAQDYIDPNTPRS